MPLLTKKEFATAIGIKEKHLPTYYEPPRNKFVYVGGGVGKNARIDTDNEINATFILERARKLAKEGKEVIIDGVPVIQLGSTDKPLEALAVKPENVKLPPKEAKQPYITTPAIPIPDFNENEPVTVAQAQEQSKLVQIPAGNMGTTTLNVQINNKNEQNANFFQLDQQLKIAQIEKTEHEVIEKKLKIEKMSGQVVPTAAVVPLFSAQNTELMTAMRYALEDYVREIGTLAGLTNEQITEYRAKVIGVVNTAGDVALNTGMQKIDLIIAQYSTTRAVGEKA